MRQLLFLSLIFFACAAPALAQNVTEKELRGLQGPVKSARSKMPALREGAQRLSDGGGFEDETVFDREGRKVEVSYYNPDGTVWRRRVFVYDGAGGTTESSQMDVCEESDAYGNCKKVRVKWKVVRDGKVEEFGRVFLRSFTSY